MIVDVATELVDKSNALHERLRLAAEVGAWTTHFETLSELAQELQRTDGFLLWLSRTGDAVPQGADQTRLRLAMKAVRELVSDLSTKPESVLNGDKVMQVRRTVGALVVAEGDRAREAWTSYTAGIEWVQADLWAPFGSSPQFAGAVEGAIKQDRQFDAFKRKEYLDNEPDRSAFERLLLERKDLLPHLPNISDEEISDFVTKASTGGAALSALTPNVLRWLDQYGLVDLYTIQRSQAPGPMGHRHAR